MVATQVEGLLTRSRSCRIAAPVSAIRGGLAKAKSVAARAWGRRLETAHAREGSRQGVEALSSPTRFSSYLSDDPIPLLSAHLRPEPAEGEGFEPSIRLTTDNGFRDPRAERDCGHWQRRPPSVHGPFERERVQSGCEDVAELVDAADRLDSRA